MSKQYAFNPRIPEDGSGAPRDAQTNIRKKFNDIRNWNESGVNGVDRPVDPGTHIWDPQGMGRNVVID